MPWVLWMWSCVYVFVSAHSPLQCMRKPDVCVSVLHQQHWWRRHSGIVHCVYMCLPLDVMTQKKKKRQPPLMFVCVLYIFVRNIDYVDFCILMLADASRDSPCICAIFTCLVFRFAPAHIVYAELSLCSRFISNSFVCAMNCLYPSFSQPDDFTNTSKVEL